MKKILLVIALILFFIVPAVAGPKTAEHPKQAGKSSIYFYDVECPANPDPECEVCGPCTGHGRFVIDAAKKTFNFIGHDFTPNRGVEISGIGNFIVKGKVTPSGNLHIQGEWEGNIVPPAGTVGSAWYYYEPAYGFMGQHLGGYVAHLKFRYSLDGGTTWNTCSKETGAVDFCQTYKIAIKDYLDYPGQIPKYALVELKAKVVGGDDTWTDPFYYLPDDDPAYCWPYTLLHGPTWNAYIEYYNDQCQYCLIGECSEYWYIWGEDIW